VVLRVIAFGLIVCVAVIVMVEGVNWYAGIMLFWDVPIGEGLHNFGAAPYLHPFSFVPSL